VRKKDIRLKDRVSEKKINKIIRTIILILVIGTPLLYARFVYNPWFISTMKITFIQVLVIIAASLYLLTEGKYNLVRSGLNYPVVAFIIACAMSLLTSIDIYISLYSLFSINFCFRTHFNLRHSPVLRVRFAKFKGCWKRVYFRAF
jgi:hypothetical protein